ncbi:MAG: hypothetical protein M3Y64_07010, partial [Gemmatimonadota bacterium]|nr:hypothetical protein [Gemmatimonadota bacterium]
MARVEHDWGLVAYNPMAGDAALETVAQLQEFDAETVATTTAHSVCALCNYHDCVTLAIAVRSKGLWTDRIATEVDDRISGAPRRAGFGVISLWSREVNTTTDVVRESAAETVRVLWSAMHGVCDTLQRAFAREGLAYAIATQLSGPSRYTTQLTPDETVTVIDAMEVIGDTRITGDIAGV